VGTRGLPPSYGGYETFADQFVKHMVPLGHEVIVACERPNSGPVPKNYHGARLFYFPFKPPRSYRIRKIYEGLNDLYFYFRLAWSCDVMYILAGLGTQMLLVLRLIRPGLRIVTNNDGLEWSRSKYNWFERLMWKSFIGSSLRFSHLVIHDNPRLPEFFPSHGLSKSITIDYGVDEIEVMRWDGEFLENTFPDLPTLSNLEKEGYFIVVARLQPDNNTQMIIRGFLDSNSERHLVVVGDVWDSGYEEVLRKICQEDSIRRVIFTGGIYNLDALNMLRKNAFAYLHGHSAGGTNPALLEAMAMGKAVIAHDNPFNNHVLDHSQMSFQSAGDLALKINKLEGDSKLVDRLGNENYSRTSKNYRWERCFSKHSRAFQIIMGRNG